MSEKKVSSKKKEKPGKVTQAIIFIKNKILDIKPLNLVFIIFLISIIAGWLILCMPFCYKNNISALDNLFTSTSAVTTTGLVTISVGSNYTFWGQIVILFLIQFGGICFMTFSSFVILSRNKRFTKTKNNFSKMIFSLPEDLILTNFVKNIVAFTLIIEFIGTIALFFIFYYSNMEHSLWNAVFHSVSAFCTAGFSLFDNSLENFHNNFWLNIVISILSISGAIGFIVFADLWRRIRGKVSHITVTSKIVIRTIIILLIVSTAVIYLTNPISKKVPAIDRLLSSFFQSMSAITTLGLSTFNVGSLSKSTIIIITFLMIIGASPSGTGGGIKSTTLTALIAIVKSVIRGRDKTYFMGTTVPERRLRTAIAIFAFYLLVILLGTFFLSLTENFNVSELFFEAVSAAGTVGLSFGVTSKLSEIGKFIEICLMFIGRISPLILGLAFLNTMRLPSVNDR